MDSCVSYLLIVVVIASPTASAYNYHVTEANCSAPKGFDFFKISEYPADTFEECVLSCYERSDCKSFNYSDHMCNVQRKPCMSHVKLSNTEPLETIGSGIYLKWLRNCNSSANLILTTSVSSVTGCANLCQNYLRCDLFSFNNNDKIGPNCFIRNDSSCVETYADTSNKENVDLQSYQRVSFEPEETFGQVSYSIYKGACPNAQLLAFDVEIAQCPAITFSRGLTSFMYSYRKQNLGNQPSNCWGLIGDMCNPLELATGGNTPFMTATLFDNLIGSKNASFDSTHFLFLASSKLQIVNEKPNATHTASEIECARLCLSIIQCAAFVYKNTTNFSESNCWIHGKYEHQKRKADGFYTYIRISYPVEVDNIQMTRYRHGGCFQDNSRVIVTNVSVCFHICQSDPKCASFLFIDHMAGSGFGSRDFTFNCGTGNMKSYCDSKKFPDDFARVLVDGWNTYVLPSKGVATGFTSHAVEYSLAIVVLLLFGSIVIGYVIHKLRMKQQTKQLKMLEVALSNTSKEIDPILPIFDQLDNLSFNPSFELPLESITVDRKKLKTLGKGQFGIVLLGSYTHKDGKMIQVAIKRTLSVWDPDQYRSLFKEICLMSYIGKHPNLVNLIGAVTQIAKGNLYLVMEYCHNGSLRSFIMKSVEKVGFNSTLVDDIYTEIELNNSQLSCSDLISFAYQIACGMEHVSSLNLIHRDLAARNILVTDNLIAKVADFGLGHQEYQFYESDKTVLLPIRWLAPEAILFHKFSIRTDVWSYGVTLGEIFSLGQVPFADQPKIDRKFAEDLRKGTIVMAKPQYASSTIYELISGCCASDPKLRWSFTCCKEFLAEQLKLCSAAKYDILINQLAQAQLLIPKLEESDCCSKGESCEKPLSLPRSNSILSSFSNLRSNYRRNRDVTVMPTERAENTYV